LPSNSDYLFSVDRQEKYLVKSDKSGWAAYDYWSYGPTFGDGNSNYGGHDMYIASNPN